MAGCLDLAESTGAEPGLQMRAELVLTSTKSVRILGQIDPLNTAVNMGEGIRDGCHASTVVGDSRVFGTLDFGPGGPPVVWVLNVRYCRESMSRRRLARAHIESYM